jgi:hypothetical protein
MTISETLKTRLSKGRPMTSITLRIPVDVVDSLKTVAPARGLAGYQSLLKLYIGEGLRRDEAMLLADNSLARFMAALRQKGVPQETLDEAREACHVCPPVNGGSNG